MAIVGAGLTRRGGRLLPVFGGVAGPTAPLAPGYLPASPAPYAALGSQRVVSGYSGPLFRLRRSDATTLDVYPQTGGDYPDYTAITTWAAGSLLSVTTVYDQSGNGRNFSEATVANQPSFDPADKVGTGAPLIWDGYSRGGTAGTNIAKRMSVTGVSFNRSDYGMFAGLEHTLSFNNSAVVEGRVAGASSAGYNMPTSGAGTIANMSGVTGAFVSPSSLDASGVSATGTTRTLYSRGVSYAGGTQGAAAQDSITLGESAAGGATYNAQYRLHAYAIYPSALSSATGLTIIAAINTAIGKPTSYDYTAVFAGDSITEGAGSTQQKNTPRYVALSLSKRVELINLGVSAETMATAYTNRANRYPQVFRSGVPNVIFVQAGTNDLGASTTGASLYATATSFVSYLQGLGYKVVLCTVLPRTISGWTGTMETERLAYNASVVGNAAGADYVLDLASNPVMGTTPTAPNDATLYVDKLHPTSLGYRWLAGAPSGTYANQYTYYYALLQVLRAVTGNGSYVP